VSSQIPRCKAISLTSVDQLYTPVQAPGRLVMTVRGRAFLAIADHPDLVRPHALEFQLATHRLAATFTQADVVFTGTTFIRMPFQCNRQFGMTRQECRMGRQDLLVR